MVNNVATHFQWIVEEKISFIGSCSALKLTCPCAGINNKVEEKILWFSKTSKLRKESKKMSCDLDLAIVAGASISSIEVHQLDKFLNNLEISHYKKKNFV